MRQIFLITGNSQHPPPRYICPTIQRKGAIRPWLAWLGGEMSGPSSNLPKKHHSANEECRQNCWRVTNEGDSVFTLGRLSLALYLVLPDLTPETNIVIVSVTTLSGPFYRAISMIPVSCITVKSGIFTRLIYQGRWYRYSTESKSLRFPSKETPVASGKCQRSQLTQKPQLSATDSCGLLKTITSREPGQAKGQVCHPRRSDYHHS